MGDSSKPRPEPKRDLPPLWYDGRTGRYLCQDSAGCWIPVTDRQAKVVTKRAGFNPNNYDALNVSETEAALLSVTTERNVAYAGPLAGWRPGPIEVCGQRILCTRGPALIAPKRGRWDTLQSLWCDHLADESLEDPEHQWRLFAGWLKVAYESLRDGLRRPGQALALAGPADSGKSFSQQIITAILGGRACNPFRYLSGKTAFNSDLIAAEHLAIEDTASSRDIREREAFGQNLKELTVNHDQSLHGKGRDALTVQVFWRVTISLNDEPYALMVLPPLDSNMRDKLILLRARRPACFPATPDPDHWRTFKARCLAELPAFLHWLTHWEIPAEIRHARYGVASWQHPDLAASLDDLHPYQRLLSLLDLAKPWHDTPAEIEWSGSVEELERALRTFDAELTAKIFRGNTSAGILLATCEQRHPGRFSKRTVCGRSVWTIKPPQETP